MNGYAFFKASSVEMIVADFLWFLESRANDLTCRAMRKPLHNYVRTNLTTHLDVDIEVVAYVA